MRAGDYQSALKDALDQYFDADKDGVGRGLIGVDDAFFESIKSDLLDYFMSRAQRVEKTRVLLPVDRAGSVYIAGPMTGLPEYNFPAFNAAAEELRATGATVYNPADHGLIDGAAWDDYLRFDIGNLVKCESIYLLPGWSKSKGARLEHKLARKLDLAVRFAPGAEQPME